MIRGFEIFAVFVFALCAVPGSTKNVSVECMISYDKGGVRAVLESSECPKRVPSQDDKQNCQFAILQGRRKYQEDRVTCNLDMKIPYLDKEVIIGIAAIFDGHGGKEASELASKKFLDYFTLNVQFNIYKSKLENEKADISTLERSLPEINDKSLHDIIEKALVTTYQDIDSEFSVEALNKGYISGSTGTVVLLLNGQLLIGYVGDSKALLCRGKTHSDHMREIYAEELTKDHHPDRDDEKARIEAAGGSVKIWGVPRVNGILAVSRAIGDVNLKRYGVIAEPEIVGWRYFQVDDSYLVIASDGIFEGITPQSVCDIIKSRYNEEKEASKGLFSRPFSLADWIVESAFKNGSTDNLSAIVIPLRPTSSSPQNHEETIDKVEL